MWGETRCMWQPTSMCTSWMGKSWQICLSDSLSESIDYYCCTNLTNFYISFRIYLNHFFCEFFHQLVITHPLPTAPSKL
jgi:hypothetical protein